MAHVNYSAGIDSVSGALAKPGSNPQHSCEKMLLATHRMAETTNPNCNRLYLRKKVVRKSAPSTDEIAIRDKFTAVSRAVSNRRKDLSKMAADQAAFAAQKTTGKKTLRAYLWMLESDAYDEQQG